MILQRPHRAIDYATREPEGCGVVAVYNHPEAARMAYLGLYALQHRGQESAGLAVHDGARLSVHKGQGLVSDIFTRESLAALPGRIAIGHVRYSTTGSNAVCNAQPLLGNYRGGQLAVAHNGNLTNAAELALALEANGAIFQSTTDSELLIHLIAQNRDSDFETALVSALNRLHGAYSMVLLHEGELWAFKDRHGFRPLCIGRLGDGWVVASETCALDVLGATFLREVKPGEILAFSGNDAARSVSLQSPGPSFCVFELIYYSRPDSQAAGKSIYKTRRRLGEELAREHPAPDADVVIAVPDSSNPAAVGFADAAKLPLEIGLLRSHYVGRTFIQPDQRDRDFAVAMKFNPVLDVLRDRSVVVVDDSIVRGTTSRKIVRMIRDAGARAVHLRITAPPWRHPCFYGIDTPDEAQLLANRMNPEEMARYLDVDSLGFLSIEGLLRSVPQTLGYCTTCFTGRYVDGRPRSNAKLALEQRRPAAADLSLVTPNPADSATSARADAP